MAAPTTDYDYTAIEIPENKDPTEYHYTTRRAEILEIVLNRGNPYDINQTQLADRYDVDKSTISKDFDRIASFLHDNLGDRALMAARSAMEKAITEEQREGNHMNAFQIAMQWAKFLQSHGDVHREPFDADITHREASTETEEYEVIEDTEAQAIESEIEQ